MLQHVSKALEPRFETYCAPSDAYKRSPDLGCGGGGGGGEGDLVGEFGGEEDGLDAEAGGGEAGGGGEEAAVGGGAEGE